MKSRKPNEVLHITFHNPNTPEETVSHLVKIIAMNITAQVIEQKYQKNCGRCVD